MYSKMIKLLVNAMIGLSCATLMVMMFLTAMDVGMRYFFNNPLVWSTELIEMCMGIMVPASVAYCTFKGAHVCVDLVYIHLPGVLKRIVYVLSESVVVLTMGIITWKSFDLVDELLVMNTITPDLGLPMWPIGVFFIFTFALTTVITLGKTIKGDQQ